MTDNVMKAKKAMVILLKYEEMTEGCERKRNKW